MKQTANVESTTNSFLYDPKYWVDFSKMIAGDSTTFLYLVGTKTTEESTEEFTFDAESRTTHAYMLIIVILSIILSLKVIHKFILV